MKSQKSSEDYLEDMLMIQEQHCYIRSIDVLAHLGVTRPSVNYATKRPRENGFITMDNGLITLRDSSMEIAHRMCERHRLLTEFFVHLGVDEETAKADVCKVVHDLSDKTFDAICRHAKDGHNR